MLFSALPVGLMCYLMTRIVHGTSDQAVFNGALIVDEGQGSANVSSPSQGTELKTTLYGLTFASIIVCCI